MMQSNEDLASLQYSMAKVKLRMSGREGLPNNTNFKVGPTVNIM